MRKIVDTVVESLVDDGLRKEPLDLKRVLSSPKISKDYVALATKLGTRYRTQLTQEVLERTLAENGIAVYPTSRVSHFMDQKVAEMNATTRRGVQIRWGWFALRGIDTLGQGRKQFTRSKLYGRPVPIEVLMTVDKLVEALGSEARFYVADAYRQRVALPREADPFLAVTAGRLPLYVVERWDEPKFRM